MNIKSKTEIRFSVTIVLDESQARALDAIAGYGSVSFLENFYKNMGKSYLKPHENGIVSLFVMIRTDLKKELSLVDKAREALGWDK